MHFNEKANRFISARVSNNISIRLGQCQNLIYPKCQGLGSFFLLL